MPNDSIFAEIWSGFRPYFVRLSVDFLVCVCLWLVLFTFKLLTHLLAIDGWPGAFVQNIHAAGTVGAFAVFAALFAVDAYRLHSNEK